MTARKPVLKSDIPKLEKAIELVEEGWGQGRYFCDEKYCVVGGIMYGCGYTQHKFPSKTEATARRLSLLVASELGISGPRLTDWNDAPNRKKYEVVRVMRKALARAKVLAGVE